MSAHENQPVSKAACAALLRALSFAKVKFLRYLALDVGGNIRCKVVPIDFLRKHPQKLTDGVAIVAASIGAMPSFADIILPDAGLTAAGTLMLQPDLETLRILPYAPDSAVVLGALNVNGTTASDLCCRSLLQRTVHNIRNALNLTVTVGVELEFILFDATTGNPNDQSHFADVALLDQQQEFVRAMYDSLTLQDISIELLHSESASGQMEIVLEYLDNPVRMADQVVLSRQTIKATARQYGMKAIFQPKVFAQQAGNGCHIHLSFRDATTRQNAFASSSATATHDPASARADSSIMSSMGQSFLEGILCHLPSIVAVSMPTSNSFRRVGQGCWTGSKVVWAVDDKEAPLRVIDDTESSTHSDTMNNTRVEFKLCDSTANIYLAMAAILKAGQDGIANQLTLRSPLMACGYFLPKSCMESLTLLESSELFEQFLPKKLIMSHVAIRRAEATRNEEQTLEEALQDALDSS